MSDDQATRAEPVRAPRLGLSGKLLVFTILFVMIAEVLIYVPSIALYRLMWLNDRLASAYTAALVLDAAPNGMVPDSLAKQILDSIGARAVAMKMGTQRRMLAVGEEIVVEHGDAEAPEIAGALGFERRSFHRLRRIQLGHGYLPRPPTS